MIQPQNNYYLLTDAKALKDLGYITEEFDEVFIPNAIKFISDSKIQGCLGAKLYEVILSSVKANIENGTSIPSRISILLDNYIVDSLGWFVQGELVIPTTNKLRNKGLITTSDDKVNTVSTSEMKYQIEYFNNRGEMYLDLMTRYIQQNISDYPEWCNSDSNDIKSDKQAYKCQIYLG